MAVQRRTLSRGTVYSHSVRDLQTQLKQAGYDVGPIDGAFGAKTRRAVMLFQKDHGVSPDGIVGKNTWAALDGAEKRRFSIENAENRRFSMNKYPPTPQPKPSAADRMTPEFKGQMASAVREMNPTGISVEDALQAMEPGETAPADLQGETAPANLLGSSEPSRSPPLALTDEQDQRLHGTGATVEDVTEVGQQPGVPKGSPFPPPQTAPMFTDEEDWVKQAKRNAALAEALAGGSSSDPVPPFGAGLTGQGVTRGLGQMASPSDKFRNPLYWQPWQSY